jgi:thiol-disulfide isomerase/thioredoxin
VPEKSDCGGNTAPTSCSRAWRTAARAPLYTDDGVASPIARDRRTEGRSVPANPLARIVAPPHLEGVVSVVWTLVATIVVVFGGLLAMSAAMAAKARATVGSASPADADGAGSGEVPAIFYFYSPTCGPCRAMAPVVDALAASGRDVHKVDVMRQPHVAAAFSVMATPTTVIVRHGEVRDVLLGFVPKPRLEAAIEGA